MMTEIVEVHAREIIDSRGNPTVEVELSLADGTVGRASVPSGASTGMFEAIELRDKDIKRYGGRGVLKAVANVRDIIAQEIVGTDVKDQDFIDRLLCHIDDTENKAMLGANAILAVSLAAAQAASQSLDMPLYRYLGGVQANTLPVPICNVINGGVHVDNELDVQEFMIAPVGFSSFADAIRASAEVYHALRVILREHNQSTAVGDEGGFAPQFTHTHQALDVIVEAIQKVGYKPGSDFYLALDCAASEFYLSDEKAYEIKAENLKVDGAGLADYYSNLIKNYPIISIEDPFDQNDWANWIEFTKRHPDIHIIGDDLFVTNTKLLSRGIKEKAANAILIKLNQIGTLTETLDAIRMAQRHGMLTIVSHRSGETEGTFIADLAVATNSRMIKTGGLSRSERIAKYNQLLRIEEALGDEAQYTGRMALRNPNA